MKKLNLDHDVLFLWGKTGESLFNPQAFDGDLVAGQDFVVWGTQSSVDGPIFLVLDSSGDSEGYETVWSGVLTGPLSLEDSLGGVLHSWSGEEIFRVTICHKDFTEDGEIFTEYISIEAKQALMEK